MSRVERDQPVQTFPTYRPDQPFTERIGLRCPYGGFQHAQPNGRDRTIDRRRVDCIAVVHSNRCPVSPVITARQCSMVQSAVGCSVTFQWTIRRVPPSSTTNTSRLPVRTNVVCAVTSALECALKRAVGWPA